MAVGRRQTRDLLTTFTKNVAGTEFASITIAAAGTTSSSTGGTAATGGALFDVRVGPDSGVNIGADKGFSSETRAELVIDVSTLDLADDDEVYRFTLLGADNAAFTTNRTILGEWTIGSTGAASAGAVAQTQDDATGVYSFPFTNLKGRAGTGPDYTSKDYLRLEVNVAGTTPNIVFQAGLAKPIRP